MIQAANKYAAARGHEHVVRALARPRAAPAPSNRLKPALHTIYVPHLGKEIRFDEWYWKELREGGMLNNYLLREKFQTARRYRAVARKVHDHRQNNKSDLRRLADVPVRDYLRWKAVDKHFWEDNANLRSLRRDNPDAKVYL